MTEPTGSSAPLELIIITTVPLGFVRRVFSSLYVRRASLSLSMSCSTVSEWHPRYAWALSPLVPFILFYVRLALSRS